MRYKAGGSPVSIEVHCLRAGAAGFERVPNVAIFNEQLSIAAIGLLNRLLADGRNHSSIDAIAEFYSPNDTDGKQKRGTGRDAYRAAAKELEAEGHLVRERIVMNGLPGWRIQVFAVPNVPNVQNVPTTAKASSERPGETSSSPSSDPTTAKPLSAPPAETTQTPSSRPTTAEPSSFLTDFSTDEQTPFPHLPSEAPVWAAAISSEGAGVQGEGEGWEIQRDTEAAPPVVDFVADDPLMHQAALFVDKLPFDQRPTSKERTKLVDLAALWLAVGWTHEALTVKCESGMGNVRNRIDVWTNHRLPAHRVTKPPAPTPDGHQTFQDAHPSQFGPPKHQGFKNTTDPRAFDGNF